MYSNKRREKNQQKNCSTNEIRKRTKSIQFYRYIRLPITNIHTEQLKNC